MAFLDKSLLQSKANGMSFEAHPILKNGDVAENVKMTYLSGCIVATLKDEGGIAGNARNEVLKIGHSLQMSSAMVNDCIANVSGLTTTEDKMSLLDEIIATLTDNAWRCYFMIEFEGLLCLNGAPNADDYELLDFLGRGLFKKEDWRCAVMEFEIPFISANTARRYFVAADTCRDRWSIHAAGFLYSKGAGVLQDSLRAVTYFKQSAELGVVCDQYILGLSYAQGNGLPKDMLMAAHWFKTAAENGQIEAQYYWGLCNYNGDGVVQNLATAVHWFSLAANKGLVEAQCVLADCYRDGEGVSVELGEAAKWYRQGAEKGAPYAQLQLGLMYARGNGVCQDFNEAYKLIKKAAEQKIPDAQFYMGVFYNEGSLGQIDKQSAIKYFMMAAAQGHADAMYNLGITYLDGEDVPVDEQVAMDWLMKAAKLGHEEARNVVEEIRGAQRSQSFCQFDGSGRLVTRN